MKVVARTIDDTRRFAGDVVSVLRRSAGARATVLGLSGPLGAGKTTLVQCIADVLGVSEPVKSPTFILRVDYRTHDAVFRTLSHLDGYRFDTSDEVSGVGWSDLLITPRSLVAVEWPERFGDYFPPNAHSVAVSAADHVRTFTFSSPSV